MNTTIASSIEAPIAAPPKTAARCPYLYPNGKRCRLPARPRTLAFALATRRPRQPLPFP